MPSPRLWTLHPASRCGDTSPRPGQTRLRHSMQTTIWFLLPSDGVFRCSSSSLQYYLTRQGRRVVLRGGNVTRPPLERYLNWVPETTPTPPRDHGKENLPPVEEPRKLPRKMRPRRKKERASSLSRHIWKPAWNQPVTQPRDECFSEASPAFPASSIHSLPAQQPIIIQHGLISWTRLNLAAYINRPVPASARNPLPDLVETTSPGLTSPSIAHSDLIETTSLGRPVGQ